MRIAIIGCSQSDQSYSRYDEENITVWPGLLAEKFPQHTYRDYAACGKGKDFFELCLLDAKMWGADTVILQTSFLGRHCLMFDDFINTITRKEVFKFNEVKSSQYPDYSRMEFPVPHITSSSGSSGVHGCDTENVNKAFKVNTEQFSILLRSLISTSNANHTYQDAWYRNVSELYNFKHVFVMDFTNGGNDPSENYSNISDISMQQFMRKKTNKTLDSEAREIVCIQNDGHYNQLGHSYVLEYLLTDKVTNVLTSD